MADRRYDLMPGQAIRIGYSWTKHQETSGTGEKDRTALILERKINPKVGKVFFVVAPITASMPRDERERRLSIQLSEAEQRAVGLLPKEGSCLKLFTANIVKLPEALVYRPDRAAQENPFVAGSLPAKLLTRALELHAAAKAEGLDVFFAAQGDAEPARMIPGLPRDPVVHARASLIAAERRLIKERQRSLEAEDMARHGMPSRQRPVLSIRSEKPRNPRIPGVHGNRQDTEL